MPDNDEAVTAETTTETENNDTTATTDPRTPEGER